MKQRHGCPAAWLVFVIIVSALGSLVCFFDSSVVGSTLPSSRAWAIPVIAVLGVVNVAFAIALFRSHAHLRRVAQQTRGISRDVRAR
jgi:hypothetical protein